MLTTFILIGIQQKKAPYLPLYAPVNMWVTFQDTAVKREIGRNQTTAIVQVNQYNI